MKNQTSHTNWNQFTHQYSLQKTLRFALLPQGKTAEHIKTKKLIYSQWQGSKSKLSGKDAELAENYKIVKKLFRKMDQLFIDEALGGGLQHSTSKENKGVSEAFGEYFNLYKTDNSSVQDDDEKSTAKNPFDPIHKKLNEFLKTLFDQTASCWKDSCKSFFQNKGGAKLEKNNIAMLTGNKDALTLLRWKIESDEIDPAKIETEFTKDTALNVIKSFEKFSTYFSGFNQNRANVYDTKELKKTSIAHRLFAENIDFYMENILRFNRVQNSLTAENKKKLKAGDWDFDAKIKEAQNKLNFKLNEILEAKNYLNFFSQSQIDHYNQILSGVPASAGEEKIQGLNEIINLTRQKLDGDKRDFPVLQKLYKQILSDRDENFISLFEKDEELFLALQEFQKKMLEVKNRNSDDSTDTKKRNFLSQVKEEFTSLYKELESAQAKDGFFLSEKSVKEISREVPGGFNTLRTLWCNHVDEPGKLKDKDGKPLKKAEKDKLKKQKALSFSQIEMLVGAIAEADVDNLKPKWRDIFKNEKLSADGFMVRFIQEKLKEAIDFKEQPENEIENKIKKNRFALQEVLHPALNESVLLSLQKIFASKEEELKNFSAKEHKKSIKFFLDAAQDLYHVFKFFTIRSKELRDYQERGDSDFQVRLTYLMQEFNPLELYNKTRNYLTKKDYSLDKIKLNFESSKLLDGFTESKTEDSDNGTQYGGYLFRKKSNSKLFDYEYYLGISKDAKLFRFHEKDNVKENDKSEYERIHYYQMKSTSFYHHSYTGDYTKDKEDLIQILSSFCEHENIAIEKIQTPTPTSVLREIENKHPQAYQKLIKNNDFQNKQKQVIENLKETAKKYLTKIPSFQNVIQKDYNKMDEIIDDIDKLATHKVFLPSPVSQKEFDDAAERKEKTLYFFKIHNKDFSDKKNGDIRRHDNLHTMYLKSLFEHTEEVVFDIGTGEVFFRPASIPDKKKFVHKAGTVLKNKRYADTWKELGLPVYDDVAKKYNVHFQKDLEKLVGSNKIQINEKSHILYQEVIIGRIVEREREITKDKRFTEDKYLLHLSIIVNYNCKQQKGNEFNQKINEHLAQSGTKNIIGIDRGEKHLLYLSVIDGDGNMIHQESLNKIDENSASSHGQKKLETEKYSTDYHELLDTKEKERDTARKSWDTIENIKELKSGYLSQVVHKLSQLIIEHNAIVVLEDLNFGFKRGRFKVEKQVYQKFERALIEKLNYLVLKEKSPHEAGGALNAFQLTEQFESFEKLGKQSGILFYTAAGYTSKTDPVSGYMKNLYRRYEPQKTRKLFEDFISIAFDGKHFHFTYDLEKISGEKPNDGFPHKTVWTVCSCVERSQYNPKSKQHDKPEVVSEKLIKLFTEFKIPLEKNQDIKPLLANAEEEFIKKFFIQFNSILDMRVIDSTKEKGSNENDYILSPVAPFYSSKNANRDILPENGDANGAYNIARKGIIVLKKNRLRKQVESLFEEGDKNKKLAEAEIVKIKDRKSLTTIFEEWLLWMELDSAQPLFEKNKFSPRGKEFVNFIGDLSVSKKEWENFCQRSRYVEEQKKKYQS